MGSYRAYAVEPEYHLKFKTENGTGPYPCHFCEMELCFPDEDFVIHHEDGNHENDELSNLVPAHRRCHDHHHCDERAIRAVLRAKRQRRARGRTR